MFAGRDRIEKRPILQKQIFAVNFNIYLQRGEEANIYKLYLFNRDLKVIK